MGNKRNGERGEEELTVDSGPQFHSLSAWNQQDERQVLSACQQLQSYNEGEEERNNEEKEGDGEESRGFEAKEKRGKGWRM